MINNVLEIIVDVFNIFELICIYFFYLNNLYNYNNIWCFIGLLMIDL